MRTRSPARSPRSSTVTQRIVASVQHLVVLDKPRAGGTSITIPAGATESLSDLSVPQADWPVLSMTNTATNQDNCSGATLNLTFAGTASGS